MVVIGQGGRDISPQDAWDHVGGLTAGQDISDRTLQFAATPAHFDLGKSRDTYGPIGPVVVSTDSFATPGDLRITCDVNGERRQDDRTSNLVFDIPDPDQLSLGHPDPQPRGPHLHRHARRGRRRESAIPRRRRT